MPANKKYLSTSPWTKLSRFVAGVVGGFFVTISFFGLLSHLVDARGAIISLSLFGFLMWAGLILTAYLIKKPLVVWLIYFLCASLFVTIIFLLK